MGKKSLSTIDKNVLILAKKMGGSATIKQLNSVAPDLPTSMFITYLSDLRRRLGGRKEGGKSIKTMRIAFLSPQGDEEHNMHVLTENTPVTFDVETYASIKTW